MTYTDAQLKQCLAKMLPERLAIRDSYINESNVRVTTYKPNLVWSSGIYCSEVKDTELLHICWLVEESLDEFVYGNSYQSALCDVAFTRSRSATWQQRTIALAKVKGVEI